MIGLTSTTTWYGIYHGAGGTTSAGLHREDGRQPRSDTHRGAFIMRIVALAFAWSLVLAAHAWSVGPTSSPWEKGAVEAVDLSGRRHRVGDDDGAVTVIVFLSTSCPISNVAQPRLCEIANRFAGGVPPGSAPVRFFGVVVDEDSTADGAREHFRERPLSFPVLLGERHELRRRLRPTHVPEAFVIDARGRTLYRGAIDDAFEAVGRRRPQVTRHWLADAVGAASAGRDPAEAWVPPVGCRLELPEGEPSSGGASFTRDVAPILHARCVACHRQGNVAPFPLTTFEEVKSHAAMILETVRGRLMPPWMPDTNPDHPFVGDRRLSDAEIATIVEWVEGGCVRGDPRDEPTLPPSLDGWQLGEPDLVVRLSEPFKVPADGPDRLQHFVVPIDIPEDKVVAAVEFHPGDRRVVHHAVLFLDASGTARRLDASTPEPGYGGFGGPGFLPSGALGGWSPGNTPRRLPGGRGRHLKRGSDLVVQVHYHPDGVERVDRSEIGLFFIDEPTAKIVAERERLVGSIWTSAYDIDIPPGDPCWTTTASYTLPKEVTVVGIVPHMHLLGKSVRVRAELPDGRSEGLVDIPSWNYAWQDEFLFERPFPLPAGTRIVTEGVFDNSSDNPSNPSKPPRRVEWGDGTLDEMLFTFLLVSAGRTEDLVHVVLDNLGHDLRQPRR